MIGSRIGVGTSLCAVQARRIRGVGMMMVLLCFMPRNASLTQHSAEIPLKSKFNIRMFAELGVDRSRAKSTDIDRAF